MNTKVRKSPFRSETAAVTPHKETARWELNTVGVCPVCAQGGLPKQMQLVSAQGIPAFVCVEHCVCLPAPDEIGVSL
jgi:hypothetical protein